MKLEIRIECKISTLTCDNVLQFGQVELQHLIEVILPELPGCRGQNKVSQILAGATESAGLEIRKDGLDWDLVSGFVSLIPEVNVASPRLSVTE